MNNTEKNEKANCEDNLKNYIILKKIGHGAHGVVYKAKNQKTNEIVAIKKISKIKFEKKKRKNILSEAYLLKKLKNENVISLKSFFFENSSLYIITEFAEKGDLQKYIKSLKKKKTEKQKKLLSEKKIWKFAFQIFSAVSYIHKNNIIHRDIKPSNIFITKKNDLKIGDFGVSKLTTKNDNNQTRVGTPLFLSPEIVQNFSYNKKVS